MKYFLIRAVAVGLAGVVYFGFARGYLFYIVGAYLLWQLWRWEPQQQMRMDAMLLRFLMKYELLTDKERKQCIAGGLFNEEDLKQFKAERNLVDTVGKMEKRIKELESHHVLSLTGEADETLALVERVDEARRTAEFVKSQFQNGLLPRESATSALRGLKQEIEPLVERLGGKLNGKDFELPKEE